MLTSMMNVLVVAVWALLGAGVIAFALYLTIYPVVKTVGGGILVARVARALRPQRELPGFMVPDVRLGYTMADGGDPVEGTPEAAPEKD